MKIREIISESSNQELEERKKKRRKKIKYGAWGPGPYGMYGVATGYSGDAGGDAGGVGEDHVDEHKKGVRARVYNKKPKPYIELPKVPKPTKEV